MGDQVIWLAPLAGAAVIGGFVAWARRRRRGPGLGSLVMWTGWLGLSYLVFAYAGGIFHNYYVALTAPSIAALVGIGVALVRRARPSGLLFAAAALAATAMLQVVFLDRVDAVQGLRSLIPIGLVLAAGALVGAAVIRSASVPLRRIGVAGGLTMALVAPAVWSASALSQPASGTFPDAWPTSAAAVGFGGGRFPGGGPVGLPAGGSGGGQRGGPGGFGGLSDAELDWLKSQRTTEKWLVAVDSSMQASAAIIAGDSVMAMGGFSGSDPAMTPSELAHLVQTGRLRFVMAGGGGFGGPGGFARGGGVSSLVEQVCAPVSASNWGGQGASGIYDCAGRAAALAAG